MDEHESGAPEEGRIRPGQLVGGIFLGFILSWTVFGGVLIALYSAYGDSTGTVQDVVAVLGLVGLPVVLGALLIPRRTRHWGAGMLMGLAIGAISGAGVCAGFFGLNAL